MSRVTAWFASNYPSVWTSTDPDYAWQALFVTSDYVDSPSYLTVQDILTAYPSGFPIPIFMPLDGRIDVSGVATADPSGIGADEAGTITQLLIVRGDVAGPSTSYIAAVIDLAAPLAVGASDTIIIYWDPAGIISPPSTVWSPTFAGGSGGGGGGDAEVTPPPPLPSPPPNVARADLYDPTNTTLIAELVPQDGNWQERRGETGSGTLTFPKLDVGELPAFSDAGAPRVIRWTYDDTPAFLSYVDRDLDTVIAESEEADQTLRLDGPGLLGLFGESQLRARAGTSWAGNFPKRILGWPTPGAPRTGWQPMTFVGDVFGVFTAPAGWANPFTARVWLDTYVDAIALVNDSVVTTTAGALWIGVAVNGQVDQILIDGVPVGATDPAPARNDNRTWRCYPNIPAGTHTIAIHANAGGADEPWIGVQVFSLPTPESLLEIDTFITQTSLMPSSMTQEPWVLYDLTSGTYPGISAGAVLLTTRTEASAAGDPLGLLIPDFDALVDSNGDDWPLINLAPDIGPASGVLEVVRPHADVWVDPASAGPVLRATVAGHRGGMWTGFNVNLNGASEVPVSGRPANLTGLSFATGTRPPTRVDFSYDAGFSSVGTNGVTAYLDLSDYPLGQAADQASKYLAESAETAVTVGLDPANTDDHPYRDFVVGDGATVGTDLTVRPVQGFTVKLAEPAEVEVEVGSLRSIWEDRKDAELSRLRPGDSIAGLTAPTGKGVEIPSGYLSTKSVVFQKIETFDSGDPTSNLLPFPPEGGRIYGWQAKMDDDTGASPTYDATAKLRTTVNPSAYLPMLLPDGATEAWGFLGGENAIGDNTNFMFVDISDIEDCGAENWVWTIFFTDVR